MWSSAGERYDQRLGNDVAGLALPADGLAKGAADAVIEAERGRGRSSSSNKVLGRAYMKLIRDKY